MMRNRQRGYTLVELLLIVWVVVVLCIIGGVGYVAFHFISKFW